MSNVIDLAKEWDKRQFGYAVTSPDLDKQQRDQLREILKAALKAPNG